MRGAGRTPSQHDVVAFSSENLHLVGVGANGGRQWSINGGGFEWFQTGMAWHLAPTSRLGFFLKVGQYSHQPCVSRLEWRQSPEEVNTSSSLRVYAGLPDCPPTVLGSREMLRPCSSAGHDSADIIGNGDPLRMDAPVGCVATAATKKLAHAGDEPCLDGQERSSPSIHQTGGNISSTPSVGLLEATSKLRAGGQQGRRAGGQLLQESGCVPPPNPQVHPHSWRVDRPRP